MTEHRDERRGGNGADSASRADGVDDVGGIDGADHRHRPRKRGDALRDSVFAAVLAELDLHGWGGFRVDRVAAGAHVSKASLYRRWPGKGDLVADAVQSVLPDPDTLPDTGSLRGDLIQAYRLVRDALDGPAGEALRGLLAETLAERDGRWPSRGIGAAMMGEIVRRGVERGEVMNDQATARRLEVGHAMLRHRFLIGGRVPDGYVDELVDEVVLPLLTIGAVPKNAGQGRRTKVEKESAGNSGVMS